MLHVSSTLMTSRVEMGQRYFRENSVPFVGKGKFIKANKIPENIFASSTYTAWNKFAKSSTILSKILPSVISNFPRNNGIIHTKITDTAFWNWMGWETWDEGSGEWVRDERLGITVWSRGESRVSPNFAWKRNESKNEQSEIAKKRVSFACFALKRNGIFWTRNEMIRSKKYRKYCTEKGKYRKSVFFTERT